MPRDLPPELVLLILETFVPSSGGDWRTEDGRKTLRDCCLVSRAWRGIAQPLLARVVLVGKSRLPSDNDELVLAHLSALETTDTVRAIVGRSAPLSLESLAIALENQQHSLSCLRLELAGHNGYDFILPFSLLKELRRLDLNGRLLTFDISRSTTFSYLTELSLEYLVISPDTLNELLTPACTPSLRALALSSLVGPSPIGMRSTCLPPYWPSLLERLDVLMVDSVDISLLPEPLPLVDYPLLVRHAEMYRNPNELSIGNNSFLPPHLFLDFDGDGNPRMSVANKQQHAFNHVGTVRTCLLSGSPLQTLVLSHWLRNPGPGYQALEVERDRLIEVSAKKGVKVLEAAKEEKGSFSVPTAFWRYAKELKAKQSE